MISLLALLAVPLLAAAGIFIFYPAPTAEDFSMKMSILMLTPAVILMIEAVGYFLISLRTFKSGLRPAYILLATGILLLPIPTLLLVLALSFPEIFISHIDLIRYLIVGSFAAAAITLYLGVLFFARLLSVKHLLARSLIMLALAVVAALGAVTLQEGIENPIAKLALQALAAGMVITFGTILFAIRIKKTLGVIYSQAMNWIIAAFIVITFDYATNVALSLWPEKFLSYLDYSDWPLIVAGFTFLMAGYHFWRSGHMAKVPDTATYLDSVTHVAQLVSDPKTIDPTLDKMRDITARKRNDEELSLSEKKELVEVYLQIEDHLVKRDPLRKITKDGLRSSLSYDFQQILTQGKPVQKTAR